MLRTGLHQSERQSEIAFVTSGFSFGTIVGPAFAAVLVANFGILSPMLITCILAGAMSITLVELPAGKP